MIPRRRLPIRSDDLTEWLRALRSIFHQSEDDVSKFERAFADYIGCEFARATTSGRDALELALDAVGAVPGDEVIIPAYTLGELLPLMQSKGLTLIPADIEQDTFNIDIESIKNHINERTKVLCATHLMGAPCDIVNICALANHHGVAVIEDCAHGLGASVSGQKLGTFGAAAIFSLEVSKAVPTYGGGMFVTNDREMAASADSALLLRWHGRRRSELSALRKALFSWMEELVVRSPLYAPLAKLLFSERAAKHFEKFYRGAHDQVRTEKIAYGNYQARIGLKRLRELDSRNARLNKSWAKLAMKLPEGFSAQNRERVGEPAFYNFVALANTDTAALRHRAARSGIDMGIRSEIMDDCAGMLKADDCPVAASVFDRAVLLPLYDGLSEKKFTWLVSVLNELSPKGEQEL